MCGSSADSMPTPVSATSIRAPVAVDATDTRTDPPRGVNFTALPTRFATTWPMRGGSWWMRIGDFGQVDDDRHAASRRRRVVLVGGQFDRRPEVVGAQVQQHQARVELRELEQVLGEPVEPVDLPRARLEELGAGVGIVAGALHEQLVEGAERGQGRPQLVRDVRQEVPAAIAVAADDLDALLEPVGHRVELDGEQSELVRTGTDRSHRHAPREIALRQGARGVGQLAQRGREATGQHRRDHDGKAHRGEGDRGQQPGDIGDGRRAIGVGVGERHLERVRREQRARGVDVRRRRGFAGLALARGDQDIHLELAVGGRDEDDLLVDAREMAEADGDVGLAQLIGDDAAELLLAHGLGDGRRHATFRVDDRAPERGVMGDVLDDRADRVEPALEVALRLRREVVVEPVDDEDGHHREGQRDDRHERDRQPPLERAWQEPAEAPPDPHQPAHRMPRSALGEGVTDTPDGQHEPGRRRIVLDLLAQVADVDIDGLLVLVERVVVAQELQQLAAGVHATRSGGQVAEDLELGRGQGDPPGAALDPSPLEIDDQVAMADDPPATGVGKVAVRPPQEGLDAAHELAQPEGLGQVVVRPELEPDHLVDLVIAGGQHEDRHLGACRADTAEDLESIDPGQPHVQDHEVRRLVRGDLESLFAGARDRDLVALLLEGVLDPPRDGVLVLDDQDGGCHAGMLHRHRAGAGSGLMGPVPPSWARFAPRGILRSRSGRLATPAPPASRGPMIRHERHTQRSDPMSTARPTLVAEHREVTGKHVKQLRQHGRLPGVVYGHGEPSTSVSVDAHALEQLRRHSGPNALVDLSVDGKKAQPVLIHGVQVHPVTRRPLHVDLFLVRMTEELIVDVPLVATGESTAVTLLGGTLLHPSESVKVKALPDHLPQSIEYPVDALVDFDGAIHVRDLTIPDDVTLMTDGDEIIAKVQPPRVEVEEVPVVAEGEEAEGEGAEAGEAGEGADAGSAEGGSGASEDS